ncbi:MAG: DUF4167 domain-containing protein [Parvibaculum sp.]|uniref:DUF4167 domain-containing protein n=1 Tax=Parvibaculum sp. TaxID=2024848 RepID=UPI003C70A72C
MRQGQNSKRSRGRGRKPQNTGNRAYDSNGPDVKIRGTAAHVCEKYQQLARDALSAGDRVMAENYYQHAEHYYRLLMASQIGSEGQLRPQNNLGYRPDDEQEDDEEDFGSEQPNFPGHSFQQQQQPFGSRHNNGNGRGDRQTHQQHQPHVQPAPLQAEASGGGDEQEGGEPIVALNGDAAAQANGAAQPSDGPRRRPGRRRRPRHEGAAGEGRRDGDGEHSEAASSGSDEVTAV